MNFPPSVSKRIIGDGSEDAAFGRKRVRRILFVCCLAGTLLSGNGLWIARISWVFLALLFLLRPSYGVFAIFFFASFFHGAGFAHDWPFTIKHFHVAVFLMMAAQLVRGDLKQTLKAAPGQLLFYAPVLAIIGIGFLNAFLLGEQVTVYAVKISANLVLVLVCMIYLSSFFINHKPEGQSLAMLTRSISFFLSGTAAQVAVSLFNMAFGTSFMNLFILHNNHLGMLCAISALHASAAGWGRKRTPVRNLIWGFTLLFILTGLVLSCSRTAWLGFLAGFAVFSLLLGFWRSRGVDPERRGRYRRFAVFMVVSAFAVITFMNPSVFSRIEGLSSVFSLQGWSYTLRTYDLGASPVRIHKKVYRFIPVGDEILFIRDDAGRLSEPLKLSRSSGDSVEIADSYGARAASVQRSGSRITMVNEVSGQSVTMENDRIIEAVMRDRNGRPFSASGYDLWIDTGALSSTQYIKISQAGGAADFRGDSIELRPNGDVVVNNGMSGKKAIPAAVVPFAAGQMISMSYLKHYVFGKDDTILHLVRLDGKAYELHSHEGRTGLHAQNFGFLGSHRFRDFLLLKKIAKTHPWFGVGFSHEVIDIHGLHFVVFALGGLAGSALFAFFLLSALSSLGAIIKETGNPALFRCAACCFCFVVLWILASFFESYFLQFFVWINFSITLMLIHMHKYAELTVPSASSQPTAPKPAASSERIMDGTL